MHDSSSQSECEKWADKGSLWMRVSTPTFGKIVDVEFPHDFITRCCIKLKSFDNLTHVLWHGLMLGSQRTRKINMFKLTTFRIKYSSRSHKIIVCSEEYHDEITRLKRKTFVTGITQNLDIQTRYPIFPRTHMKGTALQFHWFCYWNTFVSREKLFTLYLSSAEPSYGN